jgi:hypothetical protein
MKQILSFSKKGITLFLITLLSGQSCLLAQPVNEPALPQEEIYSLQGVTSDHKPHGPALPLLEEDTSPKKESLIQWLDKNYPYWKVGLGISASVVLAVACILVFKPFKGRGAPVPKQKAAPVPTEDPSNNKEGKEGAALAPTEEDIRAQINARIRSEEKREEEKKRMRELEEEREKKRREEEKKRMRELEEEREKKRREEEKKRMRELEEEREKRRREEEKKRIRELKERMREQEERMREFEEKEEKGRREFEEEKKRIRELKEKMREREEKREKSRREFEEEREKRRRELEEKMVRLNEPRFRELSEGENEDEVLAKTWEKEGDTTTEEDIMGQITARIIREEKRDEERKKRMRECLENQEIERNKGRFTEIL